MAARWIIIPHLMYVIMQVTVTMPTETWWKMTGLAQTGTGYSRVGTSESSGVKWMTCLALVI